MNGNDLVLLKKKLKKEFGSLYINFINKLIKNNIFPPMGVVEEKFRTVFLNYCIFKKYISKENFDIYIENTKAIKITLCVDNINVGVFIFNNINRKNFNRILRENLKDFDILLTYDFSFHFVHKPKSDKLIYLDTACIFNRLFIYNKDEKFIIENIHIIRKLLHSYYTDFINYYNGYLKLNSNSNVKNHKRYIKSNFKAFLNSLFKKSNLEVNLYNSNNSIKTDIIEIKLLDSNINLIYSDKNNNITSIIYFSSDNVVYHIHTFNRHPNDINILMNTNISIFKSKFNSNKYYDVIKNKKFFEILIKDISNS